MDDVQILVVTIKTTVPGLTLEHFVRAHEGDELGEDAEGRMVIQYGPSRASFNGRWQDVAGDRVTIPKSIVAEMTVSYRVEPKVRPSIRMRLDREAAELAELTKKLGVEDAKAV